MGENHDNLDGTSYVIISPDLVPSYRRIDVFVEKEGTHPSLRHDLNVKGGILTLY